MASENHATRRPEAGSPRGSFWILGAILLVGAALRFQGLDAREISMDEAFSWRMTRFPTGEMLRRLADDVHPPLYYLLLKPWTRVAGDSLTSMRGLSALLGLMTVAAVYPFVLVASRVRATEPVALRGAAEWAGLAAAGLVASSPFHVAYSRSIRMYSLGTLLAALSSFSLLLALQGGPRSRRRWVGYSLITALSLYCHYYLIFTFLAQMLAAVAFSLLTRGRGGARVLPGALLAGLVATLAYAPWAPIQFRQARDVWAGYWIPTLTAERASELAFTFITGLTGGDGPGRAIAWALGAAVIWSLLRGRSAGRISVVLLVLTPWLGAVALAVFGGRTVLLDRYLIFAHLFFLAALALALVDLPPLAGRACMGTLVLLGGLLGLTQGREAEGRSEPRGNLESLVRRLGESGTARRPVLVGGAGEANQILYHASRIGLAPRLQVVERGGPARGHRVYAASIPQEGWSPRPGPDHPRPGPALLVQREEDPINHLVPWASSSMERFTRRGSEDWYLLFYE